MYSNTGELVLIYCPPVAVDSCSAQIAFAVNHAVLHISLIVFFLPFYFSIFNNVTLAFWEKLTSSSS